MNTDDTTPRHATPPTPDTAANPAEPAAPDRGAVRGTGPSPTAVAAALGAFHAALLPVMDLLMPFLEPEPDATTQGPSAVSPRRRSALALMAALIRQYPALGTPDDADAVEAGVAAATAGRATLATIEVLASRLKLTVGRQDTDAWWVAGGAIQVGEVAARRNGSLNVAMAPVRTALRQSGPRTTTAVATANVQQQKSHAAQQRATRAQQRAARAQRAATRATQAHADAHPTSVRAIPVDGPSSGEPPQGGTRGGPTG